MSNRSGRTAYRLGLLAGASLCALWASAALADDPAPAPAPTSAEIVVTAQKTAERVIDVPLTVNALSAATLREAHVEQPEDLAAHLPNVDVKQNIPGRAGDHHRARRRPRRLLVDQQFDSRDLRR